VTIYRTTSSGLFLGALLAGCGGKTIPDSIGRANGSQGHEAVETAALLLPCPIRLVSIEEQRDAYEGGRRSGELGEVEAPKGLAEVLAAREERELCGWEPRRLADNGHEVCGPLPVPAACSRVLAVLRGAADPETEVAPIRLVEAQLVAIRSDEEEPSRWRGVVVLESRTSDEWVDAAILVRGGQEASRGWVTPVGGSRGWLNPARREHGAELSGWVYDLDGDGAPEYFLRQYPCKGGESLTQVLQWARTGWEVVDEQSTSADCWEPEGAECLGSAYCGYGYDCVQDGGDQPVCRKR